MTNQLTREEMIALVRRMMNGEGDEQEVGEWLERLARSAPHLAVSDLIYHSSNEASAEEIVDAALSYVPIALSDAG